jgi:hypothetical protein
MCTGTTGHPLRLASSATPGRSSPGSSRVNTRPSGKIPITSPDRRHRRARRIPDSALGVWLDTGIVRIQR